MFSNSVRIFLPSAYSIRTSYGTSRIGNRDVVGHGCNGMNVYKDDAHFPFPAIRFQENTPYIAGLRLKEKGDWKMLTCEEKKCLYRASFCQTFAEFQSYTGQWKFILGGIFFATSFAFWWQMFYYAFVTDERPASLSEESRKLQLRRMIEIRVNPIDGLSSLWNYDENEWKFIIPDMVRINTVLVQNTRNAYGWSRIGNRDVVGHGHNGMAVYKDDSHFPFPAIRFRESDTTICGLREKEQGDWRMLSCEEKKCLYRASFCQTFAEFQAFTGQWKLILGGVLFTTSFGFWAMMFHHFFVNEPLPESLSEERRAAGLRQMLETRTNPIDGISSKWDYDKDTWKLFRILKVHMFGTKFVVFAAFYIIEESKSLVTLPDVDDNPIIQAEYEIRATFNNLFHNLGLRNVKEKPRLNQFALVYNYFISRTLQDYNTLKEIAKLTRVDKTQLLNVGIIDLLNEILDEENVAKLQSLMGDNFKTLDYDIEENVQRIKNTYNVEHGEDMELNNDILKILQQEDSLDLNVTTESPNSNTISDDHILDDLPTWNETEALADGRRIYQGKRTKIKDFPFMASVQIFGKFQCGGSIIKADLVLTAASCLQLAWNNRFYRENPLFLSVRVGSTYFETGGENIDVMEVYFHPGYNPKNLNHNVAVMRLVRQIHFKKKVVKKIRLDTRDNRLPVNVGRVQIVGWGAKTSANVIHSAFENKLHFANLDIYGLEDCQDVYSKEYVTHHNFCAGAISVGSGACNRDVGDPGIIGGILTGIVSFGAPVCGTPDAPTVFTKIGFYYDWIEEIMEQHVPVIKYRTTELPPTYVYDPPRGDHLKKLALTNSKLKYVLPPATPTLLDINVIELKDRIQIEDIEPLLKSEEVQDTIHIKHKKHKQLRDDITTKPDEKQLEAKDQELFKDFLKTMFASDEAEKYTDKLTKDLEQNSELQTLMLRLLKNGASKQAAKQEPTEPNVPDPKFTAIIVDETTRKPQSNENESFESSVEIKNVRTTKNIPFDIIDNSNGEDDVANRVEDSEAEEDKLTPATKQTKKQTDGPDSAMIKYLATWSTTAHSMIDKKSKKTTSVTDLTVNNKYSSTTSAKPDLEMAEFLAPSEEVLDLAIAEFLSTTSVRPDLEMSELLRTTSEMPDLQMAVLLASSSELPDSEIHEPTKTTFVQRDLARNEGLHTTSVVEDLVIEASSTSSEEDEKKKAPLVELKQVLDKNEKQEVVKIKKQQIDTEKQETETEKREVITEKQEVANEKQEVKTELHEIKPEKQEQNKTEKMERVTIKQEQEVKIEKQEEVETNKNPVKNELQNNVPSEKKMRSDNVREFSGPVFDSSEFISKSRLAELAKVMDNDFLMEILNEEFVKDINVKPLKRKPKRQF
ncbi:cytochrome c oxidase subunit IV domain-containing protein [Phthorimaea operculella]|nr:cytochrome c oxidase subunit IV domain-containing protein [Phthorimaea operculella]